MSTRHAAADGDCHRRTRLHAALDLAAGRRVAEVLALVLALALPPASFAQASPAATNAQPGDNEMIVTMRTNGVDRGEFTVLRKASGDFWIPASDLARLQITPREQARREQGGQTYYSAGALGAASVRFDEADLSLTIDFRPEALRGTRIDLATRQPPIQATTAATSLVLSYRLTVHEAAHAPVAATLDDALNVRVGPVLLRQETRLSDAPGHKGFRRGVTQLVWDDLANARRVVAGDVVSTAGAYGSTITGAGVLVQKLYDLAPDVIRYPTAHVQASTALPAQVEVSVDGSPIYRGDVAPGPIRLDNLNLNGGTRTVRVVITDAAGHREVIEQPFLFTDAVLAKGFHEYSYFAGKRSELGPDDRWHYREPAVQGYHRYGVTDSLTVGAGGEGNGDFQNLGGGISLRSDRLGLLSTDLLASADRQARTVAHGWSLRYSYVTPYGSLLAGRRVFGSGFRSFNTGAFAPFPRSETRLGLATTLAGVNLSADLVRTVRADGSSDTRYLRASTNLTRRLNLFAEYESTRFDGKPGWACNVYLRLDLDADRWVSSTLSTGHAGRSVEVQAGKQLNQGEGVGYRVGVNSASLDGRSNASTFGELDWNLRPVSLGVYASEPLRGRGGFVQATAAGALVGLGGYWGVTREVNDSFALVRLGVPQAGVRVLVNNQVQGRTDANGELFIPQLTSFGRQEVSIGEKDLGLQYDLPQRRRTIVPGYRSGTVVEFGVHRISAVAGTAWAVRDGQRKPIVARAFALTGPGGRVRVETGSAGDFYLENVPAGTYEGKLQADGRAYACRMQVPKFAEPVLELKEGITCE